jgi:hypothetical protein
MKCKVIDSRDKKEYAGVLLNSITIGQTIKILLANGVYEFHIAKIKRYLVSGNNYYIHDAQGIRFTLIFQ